MIKVFDMFAGYGGSEFALSKAGIEHECIGFSEIYKYSIQCFEKNHKGKDFGDCTKINPDDLLDFDLLTGGFPCQSFSVAGKGLGEQDTRGTLFHEIIRIAEVKKPRYMLLENVKGLTFKNHKETFKKILSELKRIGYYVKWKVLNTKEHGIPQNRERVFFVCFWRLGDWAEFNFPEKEELKILLKDILEEEVDDKYYLSEKQIIRLLCSDDLKKSFSTLNSEIANCMISRQYASWRGNFISDKPLLLDLYNKKVKNDGDPSFTITSQDRHGVLIIEGEKFKIRKLTPKECFRLMGFLEDEINLEELSDTQKYKLAGNGWDINLVSKIFRRMFT